MDEPSPPARPMGRDEAASPMRKIEVRGGGESSVVTVNGEPTDMRFEMSSDEAITFPAVWLDGNRVYAVEVWSEEGLVLAVPPESEEVNAAFDQHEQLREERQGPTGAQSPETRH